MPKKWSTTDKASDFDRKDIEADVVALEKAAKESKSKNAIAATNLVKQKWGTLKSKWPLAGITPEKQKFIDKMIYEIRELYNDACDTVEEGAEGEGEYAVVFKAPKRLFNGACLTLLKSALAGGSGYGTPGPTLLHKAARHHHVTNKDGVAFAFIESPQKQFLVLGYGTKHNRNTGRGDSGYDWVTK